MKITRRSPWSGNFNTRDVSVTAEQLAAWRSGELAQDAMPDVPAEDREFTMTGYTPEDWAAMFPPEKETR